MSFYDPRDFTYESLTAARRRAENFERYVATMPTDIARRLSDIADAYPWARAGVLYPLADAGLEASDPAVHQAMQAETLIQARDPMPGQTTKAGTKTPDVTALMTAFGTDKPASAATHFNNLIRIATAQEVIQPGTMDRLLTTLAERGVAIPTDAAQQLREGAKQWAEFVHGIRVQHGAAQMTFEEFDAFQRGETGAARNPDWDQMSDTAKRSLYETQAPEMATRAADIWADPTPPSWIERGLQTIWDEGIKPATRIISATLEAPWELLQAIPRQAHAEGWWGQPLLSPRGLKTTGTGLVAQTTLGAATYGAISGEEGFGLGEGITHFGSPAQRQATRVQQQAWSVDGHAWTAGRGIAGVFFDADTEPYNIVSGLVDAATLWKADPANLAGKVASDLGRTRSAWDVARSSRFTVAARTLEDQAAEMTRIFGAEPDVAKRLAKPSMDALYSSAGAHQGLSKWLDRPTVAAFLNGTAGKRVVQFLTETDEPYKIWRYTNGKLPVYMTSQNRHLTYELARATDPDDVRRILTETLGLVTTETPKWGRWGYFWRRAAGDELLGNRRFPGRVPDGSLSADPTLLNRDVKLLDDYMRNANVPVEDFTVRAADGTEDTVLGRRSRINLYIEGFAEQSSPFDALYQGATGAASSVEAALIRQGVDVSDAKRLTRLWGDEQQKLSLYAVDEVGKPVPVTGADNVTILADGTEHVTPAPQLISEFLHSGVPLPNADRIKELAHHPPVRWLLTNPASEATRGLLRWYMNAWRTTHLLRPAWTVRVVGDEQARMAASGLDSMFSHPLSYIAWVAASKPDSKLGRWLETASDVSTTLTGRAPDWALRRGVAAAGGETLEFSDEFVEAMYRPFLDYNPLRQQGRRSQRVPNAWVDVERGAERFGEAVTEELSRLANDPLVRPLMRADTKDATIEWFTTGPGATWRDALVRHRPELADDLAFGQYLDEIQARVDRVIGDSEVFADAVRTGAINGTHLSRGMLGLNPKAVTAVTDELAKGVGPAWARAPMAFETSTDASGRGLDRLKAATDIAFDALGRRPSNYLSRSPTFRQFYWREIERLMPTLDATAQAKLVAVAADPKAGGLPAKTISRLQGIGAGTGELAVEHVDELAKLYALEKTKHLLYDLAIRHQWADSLRVAIPFGEAWAEVFSRWARITAENPRVVRRAEVLVQGAREASFEPLTGDNTFFFKHPVTGQEVFLIPGTGWLSEKLLGVPWPMVGSVQGLNLIGQGLPGFGPAVTFPVAAALPDKPEYDWIRSLVFPFGEQAAAEGVDAPWRELLPAYSRKYAEALFPDELYLSTFKDVLAYELSTGAYDLTGEDARSEFNRAAQAAKTKARWLFVLRGTIQLGSPSAPIPVPQVVDPERNGALVAIGTLANEYRKMIDENGYTDATAKFIDKHGEMNVFAVLPKTVSDTSLPATRAASDWARSNPDLAKTYSRTYGYFAPGQNDEFDIDAYARQKAAGQRRRRSAEELFAELMHQLGSNVYWRAYDRLGLEEGERPNSEQQEWLNAGKERLREEYPGYDTESRYDAKRIASDIAELERAVRDPRLAGTEAGKAINLYLQARTQAMESASSFGSETFAKSEATKPLRDWLRQGAERLAAQYPDFRAVWDRLLSREMVKD